MSIGACYTGQRYERIRLIGNLKSETRRALPGHRRH